MPNGQKLPESDSIEELARFWDTHNLTDFEGELEVVEEPVFERETAVTIRLQLEEAEAVKEIAVSKGLHDEESGHTPLVNQLTGILPPEIDGDQEHRRYLEEKNGG